MAAEPTLDFVTKLKLGTFAAQTAMAHPEHKKTILTLNDTLEQRLPLDVQNQIIEKLNKDPDGTLAAAKDLINKDPKILDEVNKNPLKLATIMGVKTALAPAQTQAPAIPTPPAKITPKTEASATEAPTQAPPKVEPVGVMAMAPVEISEAELAMRGKLSEESAKVTAMPGFKEFAARAQNSQSMTQALDAMMGREASPQDTLKSMQDIQKDQQFFVKANETIDGIPEQMRDNVFTHIAENPDLGKKALLGDEAAKSSLMMGSMFGGAGGQGLGGMFSGEGMKGIGEMLSNLLPRLMEMLSGLFSKVMGSLENFSQSPGLMRVGNDPDLTRKHGQVVDRTLGTNSSDKPVLDANRPNDPATPMAQLGKGATPPFAPPDQQRKLDTQQPGTPTAIA